MPAIKPTVASVSDADEQERWQFVGAHRLLMGFDTPYVTADVIGPELARFDAFVGFSPRDKELVRAGNAFRLFPRLKRWARRYGRPASLLDKQRG